MARSRSRKRNARALNTLLDKGLTACAIGIGMLVLPWFAGQSTLSTALANGLRPVGWIALSLGVFLLVVHALSKKKQATEVPPPTVTRHSWSRRPPNDSSIAPAAPRQSSGASDAPSSHSKTPLRATEWSAAVFAAIEWRRFEAVCEALFAQAGFQTRSQSHGADGGVDIWLYSRNSDGPASVVQCKHWQGKPVGVREMREFYGVMASHRLQRGTYATTSTYTADAQQFAKDNGINALNGPGLLALIAKRTPEQQQALLEVAFEGEYWRPTCASCGTKMVERTRSRDGVPFWGCSNYPRCRSQFPMSHRPSH